MTACARPNGGSNGSDVLMVIGESSDSTATWPWERPSTTVTTKDAIGARGHHGPGEQFGPCAVKLSERARAILQGFPDGWVFKGKTKRSRGRQIGMAMPPPLAEAVARSVLDQLAAWRNE